MKQRLFAGLAFLIAVSPSEALAQVPGSKTLTLDLAQAIAQETLANCREQGFKVAVLVVDALNAPKVLLRDDGATASTTQNIKMKATSVMLYDRPSGPPPTLPAGAPVPPPIIPGTINFMGGVPIRVGDVTIGAVAVSGADSGAKDAACANAALAKFANRLK